CGACVDACDSVMDRIGYPRGLVRYTTQNVLDGKPARVLRPRVLVYALLLLGLLAFFAYGIATRSELIVDVIRDRNALYRTAIDGGIENGYTLRIVNKSQQAQRYRIRIEGASQLQLVDADAVHAAAAEEVLTLPLTVRAAAGSAKGRVDLQFVVENEDGSLRVVEDSRFFGPFE
ncbi:MAG TPA: FixG Ig-like domain-containing protein, partial [Arenimonas sp.]|nr:FixG Ig-like domain-containing protein [Arenimonas sp.]